MYRSNRSLYIPPPPQTYPRHLMSFPAREGGNLMNLVFPGVGHLITTHRRWRIWPLASILCYESCFFQSWRRQALMHSKRKIPNSWRTGLKSKASTSFALYLNVFKNHLYCLWHVRVLSIKPCLHTQLTEHNRSYWKVSQGWGIWSPGIVLWWSIWTAFRPREGRIWTKIFQNSKCPRGCPGGCLSFDLTGT